VIFRGSPTRQNDLINITLYQLLRLKFSSKISPKSGPRPNDCT
jgi:hypothetical protein